MEHSFSSNNQLANNGLVIGAGKGLGRYLAHYFKFQGFVRGDNLATTSTADTIIYCAADSRHTTPYDSIYQSLYSNVLLLCQALKIPHKNFIYLSSGDVYAKNETLHKEDEALVLETLSAGYGAMKLSAEALVTEKASCPLILRPTSLFGDGMRINNVLALLGNDQTVITLDENSNYNGISYEMIAQLIKQSLLNCLTGVYNCATNSLVSFKDIAEHVHYRGDFGQHHYEAPLLDNTKVKAICPSFDISTKQLIFSFLDELASKNL